MQKINFKISTKKIIFYAYLLIFSIAGISLVWTSYFLYNNFYRSLSQSTEVILLSNKVAFEQIDIAAFDTIMVKLKIKSDLPALTNTKNPFDWL